LEAAVQPLATNHAMAVANAKDAANCTLILGSIIGPIAVTHATDAATTTDSHVANVDRCFPALRVCGVIAVATQAAAVTRDVALPAMQRHCATYAVIQDVPVAAV
jgi:hypothetical protein